ncbi:MAG TPA: hypothetical protein VN193_12805 [Candidatus Angelobacter sp.]|jgi:hypothetical protein|nr:hypothetical protein [Candidatus Angelobacter sp.]
MAAQLDTVQSLIAEASRDPQVARRVMERPVSTLRERGVAVPSGADDAEVASHLATTAPRVASALQAVTTAAPAQPLTFDGCDACKMGVTAIAVTLVGLGVAGLAALTPESAVVVSIATFFGIDATAVVPMLTGIAYVVGNGVPATVDALCHTFGPC